MALYQKIHITGSTICVKSFVVLWKSAQFLGSATILLCHTYITWHADWDLPAVCTVKCMEQLHKDVTKWLKTHKVTMVDYG